VPPRRMPRPSAELGDRAFAAGQLRTLAVDLVLPDRDVLFDLLAEIAGEAEAHPRHVTGLRVGLHEECVPGVDELTVDRGDGQKRARTAETAVPDHVQPHAEQLGVDRSRHRPARRLERHLGDRPQPVAVGLQIEAAEPRYPVHDCEMRDVDGVFEHLLRMGPEHPAGVFGRVEGERCVLALGDLGQLPLRFGRSLRMPDEYRTGPLDRRPCSQPRGAIDGLRIRDLHIRSGAVEAPAVERTSDAVVGDGAADGDVGTQMRAVRVEHVRVA
jgi:hypothetical protein